MFLAHRRDHMSDEPADLHFEGLRGIDKSYRQAGALVRTEGIREAVDAFVANADRVVALAEFAPIAIALSLDRFRYGDAVGSHGPMVDVVITPDALHARAAPSSDDPEERFRLLAVEDGYKELPRSAKRHPVVHSGLQVVMSSMLTGAWTAIETLAGDLWEQALNAHPHGLSDLKGKRKRSRDNQPETKSEQVQSAQPVPLLPQFLQRYGYNLAEVMGTMLRQHGNVIFTSLEEIRSAYVAAFWQHRDAIDSVLDDPVLDALSLARNLMVHKAGRCDEEYKRRAKNIQSLPRLELKQPFPVTGTLVKQLVEPAVYIGVKLVVAVDDWLTAHPDRTKEKR